MYSLQDTYVNPIVPGPEVYNYTYGVPYDSKKIKCRYYPYTCRYGYSCRFLHD